MISKLNTIISDKLWHLSLYFGDRYNRWVFASQQKALGPCKCVRFWAMQTYTSYILAICWHLSAFKSSSHEKSIFLKIHTFFSFKFFQGQNWLTNYPDSELHGYWKTMTLSSVSTNLIFSILAEFVLWEYSIVSSLSWYSILVQHACYDRAWLTSESSQRYDNLGTVKIEGIPITLRLDMNTLSALYTAGGTRALLTILALPLSKTSKKDSGAKPKFTKKLTVFTSVVNLFTTR